MRHIIRNIATAKVGVELGMKVLQKTPLPMASLPNPLWIRLFVFIPRYLNITVCAMSENNL